MATAAAHVAARPAVRPLSVSGLPVRIALRVLSGALGLWLAASFAGAHVVLHPPRKPLGATPAQLGMAYANVSFETSDRVTLRGWWIPGRAHATVVMLHGYGNNRDEPLERAGYLHRAGYNLLVFDLRGHGTSGGDGTTVGYREPADARAAVAEARRLDAGPIVLFGYSLGAAVALEDAASDPSVSAVIEDSGFSSTAAVFPERFTDVTGLPDVPFAAATVAFGTLEAGPSVWNVEPVVMAGRIHKPLLAIVSGEDTIVPPAEGLAIFRAAAGPKQLLDVPTAGHVQAYYAANHLYEQTVLDFLARSVKS